MASHVGPSGRERQPAGARNRPTSTGRPAGSSRSGGCSSARGLLVPEDLYAVVERGAARRERHRVDARPGTRRQHQHLLRPLPRHVLAAVDGRRRGRGAARASGTGRVRLMASDTNKVWRIVAAAGRRRRRGRRVRLVGADRPVRRRRRHVAGVHHRDRRADRRRRALERRRARGPRRTDVVDLHVQPRRRLPQHAARRWPTTRRRWPAVDVGAGRRPGHRPAASPACGSPRSPTALGERLRYMRQPNLGGAGGFTRGLFEATAGARTTTTTCCSWTTTCCSSPRSSSGSRRSRRAPRTRRSSAGRCSTCCTRPTCTSPPSTPTPSCCKVGMPGARRARARPTCSATTSGSADRRRTAASTPSTTAGGRA